jgi:hypothetical protein
MVARKKKKPTREVVEELRTMFLFKLAAMNGLHSEPRKLGMANIKEKIAENIQMPLTKLKISELANLINDRRSL